MGGLGWRVRERGWSLLTCSALSIECFRLFSLWGIIQDLGLDVKEILFVVPARRTAGKRGWGSETQDARRGSEGQGLKAMDKEIILVDYKVVGW